MGSLSILYLLSKCPSYCGLGVVAVLSHHLADEHGIMCFRNINAYLRRNHPQFMIPIIFNIHFLISLCTRHFGYKPPDIVLPVHLFPWVGYDLLELD